jgi:hypothetical protein
LRSKPSLRFSVPPRHSRRCCNTTIATLFIAHHTPLLSANGMSSLLSLLLLLLLSLDFRLFV